MANGKDTVTVEVPKWATKLFTYLGIGFVASVTALGVLEGLAKAGIFIVKVGGSAFGL